MHLVILDDYQDCVRSLECFAKVREHDVTVFNDSVKAEDALVARLEGADAVVLIRERTRVSAELLARLPQLKLIASIGKCGNHIDTHACAARGIAVTECGGSGAATAELTILLMLASSRNLIAEHARLLRGQWQGSLGRQLRDRTLGVFGFGRIGEQVAHLGRAFGAQVVVWGRASTRAKALAQHFAVASTREEFFTNCDILSLHLRLNEETRAHITAHDLALMKPDALLVNTSRAELIEPNALVNALKRGRPGFAAVDVFEAEPVLNATDPLLHLANCLCTPHLGFVERDNYEAYFASAFDSINAFARER